MRSRASACGGKTDDERPDVDGSCRPLVPLSDSADLGSGPVACNALDGYEIFLLDNFEPGQASIAWYVNNDRTALSDPLPDTDPIPSTPIPGRALRGREPSADAPTRVRVRPTCRAASARRRSVSRAARRFTFERGCSRRTAASSGARCRSPATRTRPACPFKPGPPEVGPCSTRSRLDPADRRLRGLRPEPLGRRRALGARRAEQRRHHQGARRRQGHRRQGLRLRSRTRTRTTARPAATSSARSSRSTVTSAPTSCRSARCSRAAGACARRGSTRAGSFRSGSSSAAARGISGSTTSGFTGGGVERLASRSARAFGALALGVPRVLFAQAAAPNAPATDDVAAEEQASRRKQPRSAAPRPQTKTIRRRSRGARRRESRCRRRATFRVTASELGLGLSPHAPGQQSVLARRPHAGVRRAASSRARARSSTLRATSRRAVASGSTRARTVHAGQGATVWHGDPIVPRGNVFENTNNVPYSWAELRFSYSIPERHLDGVARCVAVFGGDAGVGRVHAERAALDPRRVPELHAARARSGQAQLEGRRLRGSLRRHGRSTPPASTARRSSRPSPASAKR